MATRTNALSWRFLVQQWRPFTILGWLAAYFAVMVISASIISAHPFSSITIKARTFGRFCLLVEGLFLLALPVAGVLFTLANEAKQQTMDLFRTLPIQPYRRVLGLMLGSNARHLLFAAFSGVIATLAFVVAGIAFVDLLAMQVIAVLMFAAYTLAALTLFRLWGHEHISVLVGFLALMILVGPFILFVMPVSGVENPFKALSPIVLVEKTISNAQQGSIIEVFGLKLPWQAAPAMFLAFMIAVWFEASCRLFRRPACRPAPILLTISVAAGLHLLLIGFLGETFRVFTDHGLSSTRHVVSASPHIPLTIYLGWFLAGIFLWATLWTPRKENLAEWFCETSRRRGILGALLSLRGGRGPLTLGRVVVLWVLVTAAVLAIQRAFLHEVLRAGPILAVTAGLGIFLLAYVALYSVVAIGSSKWSRGGGLLAVGAALLVPLLFVAVNEELAFFRYATPFGLVSNIDGFVSTSAVSQLVLIDPPDQGLRDVTASCCTGAMLLAITGIMLVARLVKIRDRSGRKISEGVK
jgi:hypothetical protein